MGSDERGSHRQSVGAIGGPILKKLLLILLLVPAITFASDFDRGYELGFCEGYRYVRGQFSISPISPIPPIPPVGRDRFLDGYNMGFVEGVKRAGR
jgi:hypothetical protein